MGQKIKKPSLGISDGFLIGIDFKRAELFFPGCGNYTSEITN